MVRAARFVLVLVFSWCAMVGLAWSQPPASTDEEARIAEAKALNADGVALLEAGDVERALDYFTRSRQVFPAAKNTTNVAICLDRLSRYDEALDTYETLYLKYADGLDEEDRAQIVPAMAALRKKVGNILITANTAGDLFIDGRSRGPLPMVTGLRVSAGKHRLRVTKDGYSPAELSVDVPAEATTIFELKLEPLKGLGQLRLEDATLTNVNVFVDGASVGVTPWEGTIAVGDHLVWTASDGRGSAPVMVTVIEGQTSLVRLHTVALGQSVRVGVTPRTARVSLDRALLPSAGWSGRLPIGSYVVSAAEPGYLPAQRTVVVGLEGGPIEVALTLAVDPDHPRWPRALTGRPWLGAVVGYATTPTLASGAEAECPARCTSDPWLHGAVLGLRGGYRFSTGLSVEAIAGGLWVGKSISRTEQDDFAPSPNGVRYDLQDALRVRGPFLAGGASYRLQIAERLSFDASLAVGVFVALSKDTILGTATTTGAAEPIVLDDRNATLVSPAPIVWPAIGFGYRAGVVELGVGLGAIVVPAAGPQFSHAGFGPVARREPADPGAVSNAPLSDAIADERAYGPFAMFVPQLTIDVHL